MIIQCCVCQKVRLENQWVEAIANLSAENEISHTYCPACKAQFILVIRKKKTALYASLSKILCAI